MNDCPQYCDWISKVDDDGNEFRKVDCDKEVETESDYEAQSEVLQSELYLLNKENDEI